MTDDEIRKLAAEAFNEARTEALAAGLSIVETGDTKTINPEWLALGGKLYGELLIADPDCYKSINVGPPPNLVPVQEQTPHSRHLCKTETKVKKEQK